MSTVTISPFTDFYDGENTTRVIFHKNLVLTAPYGVKSFSDSCIGIPREQFFKRGVDEGRRSRVSSLAAKRRDNSCQCSESEFELL